MTSERSKQVFVRCEWVGLTQDRHAVVQTAHLPLRVGTHREGATAAMRVRCAQHFEQKRQDVGELELLVKERPAQVTPIAIAGESVDQLLSVDFVLGRDRLVGDAVTEVETAPWNPSSSPTRDSFQQARTFPARRKTVEPRPRRPRPPTAPRAGGAQEHLVVEADHRQRLLPQVQKG